MNDTINFVHESSYIDENVLIGEGTRIWHFSHIMGNTIIGKNCVIGQNVTIGPEVMVGDGCKIQNNVSLFRGVTLEEGVFCGPSCVFTNVYNPRAFIERKHEFRLTLVKRGATIGANATILCGNTIGAFAMVGAGAVVKSDVPDYAVVTGVPAKQVGWTCKCGTTLKISKIEATGNHHVPDDRGRHHQALGRDAVICAHCKNEYSLQEGKLTPLKEH
jgi:UDP-2-acetamido-3-amino-2,3-dideoxy-glucuronate N-acetyltransferase